MTDQQIEAIITASSERVIGRFVDDRLELMDKLDEATKQLAVYKELYRQSALEQIATHVLTINEDDAIENPPLEDGPYEPEPWARQDRERRLSEERR